MNEMSTRQPAPAGTQPPERGLSTADLLRASQQPAADERDGAGEVDMRGDGRDAAMPGRESAMRADSRDAAMRIDGMREGRDGLDGADAHAHAGAHTEPPLSERPVALFEPDMTQRFRSRWDEVQIGFVDDPRRAVQQADELVAQVMSNLAESFAKERAHLESVMGSGADGAMTENLRMTLHRYRSFFQRLLSL